MEFLQQKQQFTNKLSECRQDFVEKIGDILIKSDFLVDTFSYYPQWLDELMANPPHANEYKEYACQLSAILKDVTDEPQLAKILRQFRRKMLARINWLQIENNVPTEQILHLLSELAETLILGAKEWLYNDSCKELGTPMDNKGNLQPFIILAMGKLGGGELNFSSDIDLIFTYPEHGYTTGGRRELDNAIFFTRLGQRLIKVLDHTTQDGFVYRVDMRLRPLGEGGPLALSFSAMEGYYQEQGRDWERYAMVKAKVLGDQHDSYVVELYKMLKPFVYRRYIDFSVLQSLRKMKGMIEREVRRRGLEDNIKLGAGGIREIEFIVQVFQLIRGGRVPELQTRSLLKALQVIASEQLLSEIEVTTLRSNYLFLRRTENLLQGINDEQTQTLPSDALNQQRIVLGMGFVTWADFYADLMTKMQANRNIFNALIGAPDETEVESESINRFADLWDTALQLNDITLVLPHLSPEEVTTLFQLISQFRNDISKRTIGVRGRDILDQLMPNVFFLVCQNSQWHIVLPRVLQLLVNIVSRTTYLELLVEYPNALKQLIKLCAASPMISDQLTQYPILLDELIDFNSLYQTVALQNYKSELYQYLLRIQIDDEEQQVEALRQFKQMQLLHIAAADVAHKLPTMKVSDHLTYLAEAMIDRVVQIAWQQMKAKYGRPDYLEDECQTGLLVVGYGKLGGLELGYGSDLDLVFLHDCPANSVTNGSKVIDSRQFYIRLIQRIVHLFNIRTNSGVLYEIDVRLRPQGEAGLLICSLDAFYDYQMNEAWTWEHQALVRARVVYGDKTLLAKFNHIRQQVLSQARDERTLKTAVYDMREKMRNHLSLHNASQFNLKVDEGGIGDIEFISQYLVLNYAHKEPQMSIWSDNVRILELAAKYQIMSEQEARTLTDIYIQMRNKIHQLSLQLLPSVVDNSLFIEERAMIKASWQKWLT
ncbi:bifunctional [glutamate--ammonia ligase]-adenylyl-L-tyrosine phosphorylase/[glutamate--ammonia-ligase] adenylyltransferase [Orbaceae bacterium ac157xtp]